MPTIKPETIFLWLKRLQATGKNTNLHSSNDTAKTPAKIIAALLCCSLTHKPTEQINELPQRRMAAEYKVILLIMFLFLNLKSVIGGKQTEEDNAVLWC